MVLSRSESSLTIADSCASVSPRKTPRKRSYTQVFSTPLCQRSSRTNPSDSPSASPLQSRTLNRIPASFILPETPSRPRRIRQLTPDTLPMAKTEARTQGRATQTEDVASPLQVLHHDEEAGPLLRDLSDPMRLSALLGRSREVVDDMVAAAQFPILMASAARDHARLLRNGDYENLEMARIATSYVTQRHLARLNFLLNVAKEESLVEVDKQAPMSVDSTGGSALSVPPTPPASEDLPEDLAPDEVVHLRDRDDRPNRLLTTTPEHRPPWPASGRPSTVRQRPSKTRSRPRRRRRSSSSSSSQPGGSSPPEECTAVLTPDSRPRRSARRSRRPAS